MKKRYYAWKDGVRTEGAQQEWIRLSGREYYAVIEENRDLPPEKRRHFCRLPGTENGDECYFLECTYGEYKRSRAEKEEAARRRKGNHGSGSPDPAGRPVPDTDAGASEEGLSLPDSVPDPDSDFEDRLIETLDLKDALRALPTQKRKLLERLYLSDDPVSERELARRTGVPQKTLNNRKTAALRALRRKLAQR